MAEIKNTDSTELVYNPTVTTFNKRLRELSDSFPNNLSDFPTISEAKKMYGHPCGYMVLAFLFSPKIVDFNKIEKPIREKAFVELLTHLSEKSGIKTRELDTNTVTNFLDSEKFRAIILIETTKEEHNGTEMKHSSIVVKDKEGNLQHVRDVSIENMGRGESTFNAYWRVGDGQISPEELQNMTKAPGTISFLCETNV